ncbi:hypothetical protein [Hymenobacter daeguensis]
MNHKLLSLLLAGSLLLSTLGCSKKDDPADPPKGTPASYLNDGQPVACTATADKATNSGNDFLTVDLTTTPQPAAGPEKLRLLYQKFTSEPASAYLLTQMQLFRNDAITVLYNPAAYTLTTTSGGGFTGTFSSGTSYPNPGITAHTVTGGVFTDLHP